MHLFYDKNNSWEIKAPNTIALFMSFVKSETNKKYLTLKQCAKIIYTLNQSIVTWSDETYKQFIGMFDTDLGNYYITTNSNSKGQFKTITKNNVDVLKNDFDFLFKLFAYVTSSMIIDRKKKLFIKD